MKELVNGLVSVIMSTYNTEEEYLRAAIESILEQTYKHIEFIIIDDCSTDASREIIGSYQDDRIRLICNETNLGLTKSLNKGLKAAHGEFIARMDSNDISLPDRLEKQVALMRAHPDLIASGSAIQYFGLRNDIVQKPALSPEEFRINLLFSNRYGIIHMTAMFRHALLLQHEITYNEAYRYAQDYRMWISCSQFGECGQMDQVLCKVSMISDGISVAKLEEQRACAQMAIKEQLAMLHITPSKEELERHEDFLFQRRPYDADSLAWVKRLIAANNAYNIYQPDVFAKILWNKWTEITYYGLVSRTGILEKVQMLAKLPYHCYGNLMSRGACTLRKRMKRK